MDYVTVFVEVPKGSRNKYEFDKETGRFILDRMLFSSVHYPADYGFIPGTLADDGDELDALVLAGAPTFPGCQIKAKPIAVLEMWDEKGKDDKIIAVSRNDPVWGGISSYSTLPQHLANEISHFFEIYKDLEDKKTKIGGWYTEDTAREIIQRAIRNHQDKDSIKIEQPKRGTGL